jgi:uncharacterized protein YlaI
MEIKKCNICETTENLVYHHLKHKRFGGKDTQENREWYCRKCHSKLHSGTEEIALALWFKLEELSKKNPIVNDIINYLLSDFLTSFNKPVGCGCVCKCDERDTDIYCPIHSDIK